MSHIDGRRQRRLSKAKDYKSRLGCRAIFGSGYTPEQWRRQTRHALNQPLHAMRDFHCDGTTDCECPACDNDALHTRHVSLTFTSKCDCGGPSPFAQACRRLEKQGHGHKIEPLLHEVFKGAAVRVSHNYDHETRELRGMSWYVPSLGCEVGWGD
jgi:hypothetical protein